MPFLVVVLIMAIVAIVVISRMVVVVPGDSVYVAERLGKEAQKLQKGFHILIPFIDVVRFRHRTTEQSTDLETQHAVTNDNVTLRVVAALRWKIVDVIAASYQVADVGGGVRDLALTGIRKEIGGSKLDEVLGDREALNQRIVKAIAPLSRQWGVEIAGLDIRLLEPPADVVDKLRTAAGRARAERERS